MSFNLQSAICGLQSAVCGLESANVIHREKLETELLFLKDVNIRDWNVLSVLGNDISSRYSKDFVHKTKQKRIEEIVFPVTAIKFTYSLALTWNVEWRWLLRKVRDLKLL